MSKDIVNLAALVAMALNRGSAAAFIRARRFHSSASNRCLAGIETVIGIAITTAIAGVMTVLAIEMGDIHTMANTDGSIRPGAIPKLSALGDGIASIPTVNTTNILMVDITSIPTGAIHMGMAEASIVTAEF